MLIYNLSFARKMEKKTYRTIYYNEYKKKVVYIKLYFYLLHFNIKSMAK